MTLPPNGRGVTWISPDAGRSPGDGWAMTALVRSYLENTGWVQERPGPAGALWRRRGGDRPATIAVASELEPDSLEFRSVLERVATFEGITHAQAQSRITTWMVDVARLRAVHDDRFPGSIPLQTGVKMVTAARSMVRAVATTSLRPRGHINNNYLSGGDEVAARARMGHTEEGSFVLPIWIPLPPALVESESTPTLGLHVDSIRVPDERRITRTLAQALGAVHQLLVKPEREPSAAEMSPAIAAGVSREIVQALARVLTQPAVEELETSFEWAGGMKPPPGLSRSIRLPSASASRLNRVADLLRSVRPISESIITGPIVQIRRLEGAKTGTIAVDAVRAGRRGEVLVVLDRDDLDRAHDWMRSERAVLVDGTIIRGQKGVPTIPEVNRIQPLDESRLLDF